MTLNWFRWSTGLLMVGLCWLAPESGRADTPAKKSATKFIRVSRTDGKPTALQTAIVRYVPATGQGKLTVDLVGAVHIGDRYYYRRLNEQFAEYDVVLYELVAPEGVKLPRKNADSPMAMIQDIAKLVLDLELQVELIDYTKKNFVHADMTPNQMAAAIKKRGDDGLTLFLGITADMLRQQNLLRQRPQQPQQAPADPLALLVDPDGPKKLKRMMAKQFEEMGTNPLGKTLDTILVSDRNQAALKVFQKELAKGKKKIAIFYGAAHMPDFEKRLRADFDLKPTSTKWINAWDLNKDRRPEDLLKFLLPK